MTAGPLAVLGATGYTGRLVVAEARRRGIPLRLVGRRADALARASRPGDEVRVADARDRRALADAFEGAAAVASAAGPFVEVGFAPVEAAIDAGVHYVDTSGEQAFSRRVYEDFGARAAEAGVVLLTAFGFDYVPGDLAARLAADGVGAVDDLAVAYAVTRAGTSRGTRRTIATLAGRPHAAFVDGRLERSSFGATWRRVAFPFGVHVVLEWGGTEPLTVPRHADVRSVRSYVRAPRVARVAPLARAFAPLIALSARVGPSGPSAAGRRRGRFAVVAEARGEHGVRRATLVGSDVYGLTALLVVRAFEELSRGRVVRVGALAPAEAFDARPFVQSLSPLLAVAAVESL